MIRLAPSATLTALAVLCTAAAASAGLPLLRKRILLA